MDAHILQADKGTFMHPSYSGSVTQFGAVYVKFDNQWHDARRQKLISSDVVEKALKKSTSKKMLLSASNASIAVSPGISLYTKGQLNNLQLVLTGSHARWHQWAERTGDQPIWPVRLLRRLLKQNVKKQPRSSQVPLQNNRRQLWLLNRWLKPYCLIK